MCGIVGFVNYKQDISNYKNILTDMNNTLSRRGPDEEGYFIRKHIALGHKRLIVIDPEGGKQPMGNFGPGNLGPVLFLPREKKDRVQIYPFLRNHLQRTDL